MSKADEADITSRRGFLRLGGLLSGGAAAGLLVPWAGGKVLSFAEPAKVADLAVTAGSFPTSTIFEAFHHEAVAFEMIKREFTMNPRRYRGYSGKDCPHYKQAHAMKAAGMSVFARPAETWADLADLAQIAYLAAPKEMNWTDQTVGRHSSIAPMFTGRLVRFDTPPEQHRSASWSEVPFGASANAALIEGVLRLTGRVGYDPSIAHDLWSTQRAWGGGNA